MHRLKLYVVSWIESRRLWRNPEWRRQIAESEATWDAGDGIWGRPDAE